MKLILLFLSAALVLSACGRGPSDGDPRAKTQIEETRQAEKAADAGKPLSDQSLTQIIRAALESESSIDARKIDIENRSGNVALHGVVASDEQREKAARIVAAVGGVRDVKNNLTVDPASASTGATAGATSGAGAIIPPKKD